MASADYYKHETAILDEGAVVGSQTRIWHFSHLRDGCRIGINCIIGQNVYIDKNVVIGHGVKIQNNVSVYDGVTVEDNVFIGPSAVFTNVILQMLLIPAALLTGKMNFVKQLYAKALRSVQTQPYFAASRSANMP
jgi:NDP-sugar pyrophosphorylase family protein